MAARGISSRAVSSFGRLGRSGTMIRLSKTSRRARGDLMDEVQFSERFDRMIRDMHAGLERSPFYSSYITAHLGGSDSRLIRFSRTVCPEIEYHCGPLSGKRVLDFGCGTGASTAALARLAGSVVAFDIQPESVEIARQRLSELGLADKAEFFCADGVDRIADRMGTFDLVAMFGVIEHLPITLPGLRKKILRSAAGLLRDGGCLFVGDTPNRLWPHDSHTTRLWWIPWFRPGSQWAYNRAIAKGRYARTDQYSQGPLGLEEQGAWGATYWEIERCLSDVGMTCVNMLAGHDRQVFYAGPRSRKAAAFDFVMRVTACRLFRAPITAFAPYINNLVFRLPL
jgi:2-polyprenyl-3-methyl-5-hydroxy-6-metoxy-1,4-benzoquinol methylase